MASPRPIVFLHIGTPKSGTTYLQSVLWHNREAMRDEGLLYTGREDAGHLLASFDLRDRHEEGGWRNPDVPGAWARAVDEARRWPQRTLISHETFSLAKPAQVDRALADLDFAEVHLIVTMRDLARQIPAAWQESIKNFKPLGFSEYVRQLRTCEEPGVRAHVVAQTFWRFQNVVEMLGRRWARTVPPERVHIVTLPPPGAPSGLTWQRFAEVLGLTADRYETAVTTSNPSLGVRQAQLLHHVNAILRQAHPDDRLPWPNYLRTVKDTLAQQVLVNLPDDDRLVLPDDAAEWAAERAEHLIEGLRKAGYHIVGDLDDLRPRPSRAPFHSPDAVSDTRLLETALHALAGLATEYDRLIDERNALRGELDALRVERDELKTRFEAAYTRPVLRHAVHRVGQRYRPVMYALETIAVMRNAQSRSAPDLPSPAQDEK